ncbi:MAG: rRNA maturation RNase YbeY [Chitinophagaceae bacterium]|nr:rRNA maturation RNase YbeY [Chitinophagaceae bacterium]
MKHLKPIVRFHLLEDFKLTNRKELKNRIIKLFESENKIFNSIDYIFCSDNYLLNINELYLNHNTFTDIITFDLSKNLHSITGEIYISIERVKENSAHFKVPFYQELNRVMFHGALHLCGYKDKGMKDKKAMRRKEDFYLKS